MSTRDIEDDYKRALIQEHGNFLRSGNADGAANVAAILKRHYGYEFPKPREEKPKAEEEKKEPARRGRPPKERADQPHPQENTAESKPEHSGHGQG